MPPCREQQFAELRTTLSKDIAQIITRNYENGPHRTSISLTEALALAAAVYSSRPARTLEIGFAEGGSAAAIIAAKKCAGIQVPHVVLDPYQRSHSSSRGLETIRHLEYTDNLIWLEEFSELFLSKSNEEYDFIFIDGGHNRGQAMVDAYFADRCLKLGGLISIDDIYMSSTAHSLRYPLEDCG